MKKIVISVFLIAVITALIPSGIVAGQEKHLSVNSGVTAQIRAFDQEFFKNYDVYAAGVQEAPTALLFDLKDSYHLPSKFWGSPLSEEEIVYAIKRLEDQYIERTWDLPFYPRALAIVNYKGEVVGYTYTGLSSVPMDRKKDGRVTVFRPTLMPRKDHGKEYIPTP